MNEDPTLSRFDIIQYFSRSGRGQELVDAALRLGYRPTDTTPQGTAFEQSRLHTVLFHAEVGDAGALDQALLIDTGAETFLTNLLNATLRNGYHIVARSYDLAAFLVMYRRSQERGALIDGRPLYILHPCLKRALDDLLTMDWVREENRPKKDGD